MAILSTGSGKSLCYQLPAALLPGATVVVWPLIWLIKDRWKSCSSWASRPCSSTAACGNGHSGSDGRYRHPAGSAQAAAHHKLAVPIALDEVPQA
ncbi:hypothetical protein [Janthinobacterium sp. DSP2-3-3]|uniref:hypothetical protein n=1 Tax=Janthinobacterium sp. DSP2-3-3 TaxID=2804596 RepID=UPI003CEA5D4A